MLTAVVPWTRKGTSLVSHSFTTFPIVGDFKPATWLEEISMSWNTDDIAALDVTNSMVLSFFYAEHLYEEEALLEITKMVFNIFDEIEQILLFIPSVVSLFTPLIGNFEPLVSLHEQDASDAPNVSAYITSRRDYAGYLIFYNSL